MKTTMSFSELLRLLEVGASCFNQYCVPNKLPYLARLTQCPQALIRIVPTLFYDYADSKILNPSTLILMAAFQSLSIPL